MSHLGLASGAGWRHAPENSAQAEPLSPSSKLAGSTAVLTSKTSAAQRIHLQRMMGHGGTATPPYGDCPTVEHLTWWT